MHDIEAVAMRWQRRYAGRRWVMGTPVYAERMGSLVDRTIEFDIAKQRAWHALRPSLIRLVRRISRVITNVT